MTRGRHQIANHDPCISMDCLNNDTPVCIENTHIRVGSLERDNARLLSNRALLLNGCSQGKEIALPLGSLLYFCQNWTLFHVAVIGAVPLLRR